MENRIRYYDSIKSKLGLLAYQINLDGGLNLLNQHVHAEDFYLHFMNLIFFWNLVNENVGNTNAAGIDLIDTEKKIVIQVSATATRQKLESALSKKRKYYEQGGFSFKFISICSDASHLRNTKKEYKNPHRLDFEPARDIYDVKYLLKIIKSMDIDQLQDVYEFCEKEFRTVPSSDKIETNLATIINILSKENWNNDVSSIESNPYEIDEKIEANGLLLVAGTIEEHAPRNHRISQIYSEFDVQGANKSLSILNGIRRIYLNITASKRNLTPDQIFLEVVKQVVDRIKESSNYKPIPLDELALSAEILVVDTFIRCKIFKNPTKN